MNLPTLYSTFNGKTTNEVDCFKLLDIDGWDVTDELSVKSFEITISSGDRMEGALVTVRSYVFNDSMKKRLGIQYYAEEEAVFRPGMHIFSFRANIKLITKEPV